MIPQSNDDKKGIIVVMNYFSKKTEYTLLGLSFVGLLISAFFIFYSGSLLYVVENLLETKVFHREFDLARWSDTINALLAFPVFIVIVIDALLFLKFSNRTKVILLLLYGVVVIFFILTCCYNRSLEFMDSDMASEILLAKECFLEKSFWPKSWNYSTEIRLLNTQLITAPIFAFTSNLVIIKTISVILLSLLLPLSLWFLLTQLEIKVLWQKLLWCLLILCPWSGEMWRIVQFGSYYIPHIVIAFLVIGLFFGLTYRNLSKKKKEIFFILYIFLSFTSGLAGIRYILYFQFPLALTLISLEVNNLFKEQRVFCIKQFFIENKAVFYSCLALVLGGLGYIFNTLVLSSLFSFADFNTTAFTTIGDVSFPEVQNAIMGILGYKNEVSVFTPSGIINILLYVGLSFFILTLIAKLKFSVQGSTNVFLLFCIIMFIFNAFVFINTEFIGRYFILLLVFLIPCIAVLCQSGEIGCIRRYIASISFVIVLLSSSFITYEYILCSDNNTSKYPVRDFLLSQEYEFGYGTFWNANVFNYLTNGKIDMGNLDKENNEEGIAVITQKYEYDNWLTPKRYYSNDYGNKPIFLILSQAEYEIAKDNATLSVGKEVYSDQYYKVFEYPSHQAFKESFTGNEF